jgi:hypothetical protein
VRIDPDNVEESVLVKNAIKQAKKYQEQLKKLSKKEDIEDDELEVLKTQLPTWWDYELQAIKETAVHFPQHCLDQLLDRALIYHSTLA